MVHGINTCEYCRGIFAILTVEDAWETKKGIRFNELLKLAQISLEPKIAAPTLTRHLKYLVGKRIVKRIRKGKQNVIYCLHYDSPIITQESLELSRKWRDYHAKEFHSWSLEQIIKNVLSLSALLELEVVRLWMQKQLPGAKQEGLALRIEFVRAFYKQYTNLLLNAAKERAPLDYKQAIESMSKRITDLKRDLFVIG